MKPENVARLTSELKSEYADVTVAKDGDRSLVRLPRSDFPGGCSPRCTAVLVVLDPGQPQPQFFIQVVPNCPKSGQVNANPVTIAGESWFAYSFNLRWDEDVHTAVQFVEGKLRRFARNA